MKLERLIKKYKKEIISLTQTLIRINSVNGNETTVCKLIAKKLSEHGIESKLVGKDKKRLNLLAKVSGEKRKKRLLLAGHTDTVSGGNWGKWQYPPFAGKLVVDKIYGRGSADMKGGLASVILTAIILKNLKVKLKGKIVFAFTANEENPSKQETGIQYLLKKDLIKADAAIIAEPGTQYLNIGSRGVYRLKLISYGRSWHTGRLSQKGINAVTKMAKVLLALENLKLSFKKHKLFPPPKIIPGTIISGGRSINIVPDKCEAKVDCRLSFGQTKKLIKKEVENLIKKLKKDDPQLKVKMKEILFIPPAATDKNHPLIKTLQSQARQAFGKTLPLKIAGPAGDNNFLIDAGIPTVLFGPDGENFHSENEFVYTKSIFKVAYVFVKTATEYLNKR